MPTIISPVVTHASLYSFKNRPNDIGMKKSNTIYYSTLRHINTSTESKNIELKNTSLNLNTELKDTIQNEFQCKDYIPSKIRKKFTPLKFPPNLMKEMVTNLTQNNSRKFIIV